jgi:hypothetical protein
MLAITTNGTLRCYSGNGIACTPQSYGGLTVGRSNVSKIQSWDTVSYVLYDDGSMECQGYYNYVPCALPTVGIADFVMNEGIACGPTLNGNERLIITSNNSL